MDLSRRYIPDLHRQSPAIDFIENRLDAYHPAFGTPPSQYDPDLDLFIVNDPQPRRESPPVFGTMRSIQTATPPPLLSAAEVERPVPRPLAEPSEVLKFWDSLFEPAMMKFTRRHTFEPLEITEKKRGIRDKRDWTGVFDQLDAVKQEYSQVDKGFKARYRKVYRKFADHIAPSLLGVVDLVPNNEYVSPVLGVVQVLLEAAIKAAQIRQEMLSAFDDIDMKFSQVELFLEIYKADKNIENASVDLIASIFYAVECVIGFFVKKIRNKFLSATFTTEQYQQNIAESLAEVEKQSENLIDQAQMSSNYEMSHAMREVLSRTSKWKSEFERIHSGHEQIRRGQVHLGLRQDIWGHSIRNSFKTLLDELESSRQDVAELKSIVLSQTSSSASIPYLTAAERHVSPQELLDWIDIPDLASQDLEDLEEKRQVRVPADERARAEQLIQARQFQEWLVCPTSSQLLIHGNYDGKRLLSGLSLFCASFIEALAERAPRFLHLVFFCGLHEDPMVEDYTGGQAMIQSFTCQLLCQFDFGAGAPAAMVSEELIRSGDLEHLCAVFEWLVGRLPREIVLVCIIDGIVYYERPWFLQDMGTALVTILGISAAQNTQAAVKVLVTSPTMTTEARQPFPDGLIISMDAMAQPRMVASKLRLERQLREGFDDVLEGQGNGGRKNKYC